MEEVVVSDFSEPKVPQSKICPLRALAYTIARREAKPVCIKERCAWYVQSCECCAVKMFAVP